MPSESTDIPRTQSPSSFKLVNAFQLGRTYGIVFALVAMILIARIIYPGFLSGGNLQNIISQSAPLGIVAVGITFVILAAGFDLSVASVVGVGAVLSAKLSNDPIWLIIVAIVLSGLALGAANGLIITKLKVNPFIATLATSSIISGATLLYTKDEPIQTSNNSFSNIGLGMFLGLRIPSWILIVAMLVGGVVLWRTVYGRSIYAIGGNNEAARLAGLRTDLIRTSAYAISGLCAAVSGLILASTLSTGQADVGQSSYTLGAITVVVIGGTSLFGGEGAMWRTAVGLALIAAIDNLFNSLAINSSWQSIVQGAILLLAVGVDIITRRIRR
jgi:ribose transport system permease protein